MRSIYAYRHGDPGLVRHRLQRPGRQSTGGSSRAGRGNHQKDVMGFLTPEASNSDVWGVSMIGDFEDVPPPDIMIRVGRLLGWRLSLDHVDLWARCILKSAGGQHTVVPGGKVVELPEIFAHRDVGNTECPGGPRLRRPGRNPQDRSGVQRTAGRGGFAARWSNPGPLGSRRRPERAHWVSPPPGGGRRRLRPLRDFRTRGHVLVAQDRRPTAHRCHLRGMGIAGL